MRWFLFSSVFLASAYGASVYQARSLRQRTLSSAWPGNAMGGDREMMSVSDTMRAMMCWGKPDLIDHPKCMKFLDEQCEGQTTGVGVCQELKDFVKKECLEGKGGDKALGCKYSKRLGVEDEAVVEEVKKVEAEEAEAKGETVSEGEEKGGADMEAKAAEALAKADTVLPPGLAPSSAPASSPASGPASSVPAESASDSASAPAAAPESSASAPAPGPSYSPGSAPAPGPMSGPADAEPTIAPQPFVEEQLNKAVPAIGLPDQGFNGAGKSEKLVSHQNYETLTSDWNHEWPQSSESEEESTANICRDQEPMSAWCRMYLKDMEKRGGVLGGFKMPNMKMPDVPLD